MILLVVQEVLRDGPQYLLEIDMVNSVTNDTSPPVLHNNKISLISKRALHKGKQAANRFTYPLIYSTDLRSVATMPNRE